MITFYKKLNLVVLTLLLVCGSSSGKNLPNIVFYIADDMGQMDASIYGSGDIKTPTLEKLAAMGMTFDNAFVASPSCAPSRAALLSGLMPARNGAEPNHSYPDPNIPMLTKPLQDIGYEVVAFGKVAHYRGAGKVGFDYFSDNQVNLAARVREYMAQRKSKKPLCLLVGDRRPHVPWISESQYDPGSLKLPDYLIDTKETREHWARYCSDITGLDDEMGQIQELVKSKFKDNFIFLFSSDHGGQWPFGKWNLYDTGIKTPLVVAWPEKVSANTRSKAMVSWVDIFPTLIEMVDAEAPSDIDGKSFYHVLKNPARPHRNLIFTTHSGDGKWNVYPIRSVRSNKYKYILNLLPQAYHTNHSDILRKDGAGAYWHSWDEKATGDPEAKELISKYYIRPAEEFYDLEKDPFEQVNLVNNPGLTKEVQEMRAALEEWMKQQGDARRVFNTPYYLYEDRPTKLSVTGEE